MSNKEVHLDCYQLQAFIRKEEKRFAKWKPSTRKTYRRHAKNLNNGEYLDLDQLQPETFLSPYHYFQLQEYLGKPFELSSWRPVHAAYLYLLVQAVKSIVENEGYTTDEKQYLANIYYNEWRKEQDYGRKRQNQGKLSDQELCNRGQDPFAPKKKTKSARNTLPNITDWRERTLAEINPRLEAWMATLILDVTGARPGEVIKTPVTMWIGSDGLLHINIIGEKHSRFSRSGQPWRELIIRPANEQEELLFDIVAEEDEGHLEFQMLGTDSSQPESRINNLQNHLKRAAVKALPRYKHNLRPYHYRHQLAADLKSMSQSPDCSVEINRDFIAKVLGQASDRTQSVYGHAKQGQRTCGIVAINAPELVKKRWAPPTQSTSQSPSS